MPWFVLYTKSNNEKKVAERLSAINIDVYCPTIRTERKWSDRIKVVEVPLFKSFCFVNLDEKDRAKVFTIPGVVRYLFWLNKPAVVQQKEIDTIRELLNSFNHNLIKVETFKINESILINSGVFEGKEAIVLSYQGKKIMVKIDSLDMYISIDLTKSKIQKQSSV
ncbi:UpxY family transcription antiterminator [Arcicella rigui]|uniref:UpxY family transcription antiterminator n=1 Tax=Arcicella rigui TaxID=797020 RepID=A0ABU5QEY4_9BACT|nr:UpxY family transcription antiterminator [Arcicella rigui]MEA5141163.1 UpxY family transcription antiterminator [Arcicella rigui]